MKNCIRDIIDYIYLEFKIIATSYSILLVLIGGIFVYGFLYNYMYRPNVLRNVPIAVVDKSNSELTREYIRLIDASPNVRVFAIESDMAQAKELIKKNDVKGIIYLPSNFDTNFKLDKQSMFISYGVTEAFLYYSALQEASTGAMLELNDKHRLEQVVFLPKENVGKLIQIKPITISSTVLYNTSNGYGNYLIPAVLMVIIFQTLFMIIGMISGKQCETGGIYILTNKEVSLRQAFCIVMSKTFVYCCLYAIFCLFLLGFLPVLFDLPNLGRYYEIVMLMIPYLLSSSFFALTLSVCFTDSETPVLMIAFFSVGLLFLSGVSYPLELMPWYWRVIHYFIPASSGTYAFIKLNSIGATLTDIKLEYLALWGQTIVYFILSCLAYKYNLKKARTTYLSCVINLEKL